MVAAAALTPLHQDALRELCNLCGGRAADALSRLLGERRVDLGLPGELPRGEIVRELGESAPVVAARVELDGPLHGELWLVLAEGDAQRLSALLDDSGVAGVAIWVLYETANIVASVMKPSVPSLPMSNCARSAPASGRLRSSIFSPVPSTAVSDWHMSSILP